MEEKEKLVKREKHVSKYKPHQGKREVARRKKRVEELIQKFVDACAHVDIRKRVV